MRGETHPTGKIGVFGGSFDPVHLGHTGLARDAMKQVGLDQVIFVPAKLQPFKLDKALTPGSARSDMLRIATEGNDAFRVSSYELESEEISYTCMTMRAMQRMLGSDIKLYFITGTDAFLKIETWKNAEELLTSYAYIIGARPGWRQDELRFCMDRIRGRYGTEMIRIANVQVEVSSTEIRGRLKCGLSAEGLLDSGVERYIKENGLYGYASGGGKIP